MGEVKENLRIIAVYKTFRGKEFALDSLASIYSHVRRVVFVHSDVGWDGTKGNDVRDVVKTFPDPDNKIVHVDFNGSQKEQYNAAVRWINDNEENMYEYLMLIDTDEVWEESAWRKIEPRLIENIQSMSPCMSVRCALYDYIKSPFYRVDPPAPLKPVVFVHAAAVKLNSINVRGADILPTKVMHDIWFHHFCSVRLSLSEVWGKHSRSCNIESEPIVDKAYWIKYVWNQLPFATDLLPLLKFRSNWKAVKVITEHELPAAVIKNPLVQAWLKYPKFTCNTNIRKEDMSAELVKCGLPKDFGPGHVDWNIPSKRRRYDLMLAAATENPAGPVVIQKKPANTVLSLTEEMMSTAESIKDYTLQELAGIIGKWVCRIKKEQLT